MPKPFKIACALISLLAVSACSSAPLVQPPPQCPPEPEPPAWVMQPPPNFAATLSRLFTISDGNSTP